MRRDPDKQTAPRPQVTAARGAAGCHGSRSAQLCLLASALVLTSLLCGCAAYGSYRKCGHRECPGDAQITAEVRALLDQHPELGPPNQVYVQTLNQIVYLSGEVATDLQRDTADALAGQVAGARRVVDIIGLEYNGR
jgi:BON domain-containing protein